jgi:hypothetical protein
MNCMPALSLLLCASSIGCAPPRDQPEYLEELSGIRLCDEAEVLSVAPWQDFGVGWEYEATLRLNRRCQEGLLTQLARKGAPECEHRRSCSAELDDGSKIQFGREGESFHLILSD